MKTPRGSAQSPLIFPIGSGEILYVGIERAISRVNQQEFANSSKIVFDIGCDGFSPFKNSPKQMWETTLLFVQPKIAPELISVFLDDHKPDDKCLFMVPFCQELLKIQENGLVVGGRILQVELRCYRCDAIARPMLTGTAYPSAYAGCPRCDQRGDWIGNYSTHVYD